MNTSAQRAGVVRGDVRIGEVMALIKGVFAAREGHEGSAKGVRDSSPSSKAGDG